MLVGSSGLCKLCPWYCIMASLPACRWTAGLDCQEKVASLKPKPKEQDERCVLERKMTLAGSPFSGSAFILVRLCVCVCSRARVGVNVCGRGICFSFFFPRVFLFLSLLASWLLASWLFGFGFRILCIPSSSLAGGVLAFAAFPWFMWLLVALAFRILCFPSSSPGFLAFGTLTPANW